MTRHDHLVLDTARNELKNGAKWVAIGDKVASRKIIVNRLKKSFPGREITIERNCDFYSSKELPPFLSWYVF